MAEDESELDREIRRRWQLVLGRDARRPDGSPLSEEWSETDERIDSVLSFLFDREHEEDRSHLRERSGGEGRSALLVPEWLAGVRRLFPRSTAESLTRLALERYQLAEVLADEKTLEQVEPSIDLLRALLTVKGVVPFELLGAVRRIIRQVVEELRKKFEVEIRRHFAGARRPRTTSPVRLARNFDIRRTIRENLPHYQPAEQRLYVDRTFFFSRVAQRNLWDLILVVDQSGSMLDSLIHAAVMTGIFRSLPMLRTRLILFDTEVVDLSDQAGDAVEILFGVTLGGGTDIGKALRYADSLIANPRRTILVLVSDFYEGATEADLLAITERIAASGVTMLGLAALDDRGEPAYNRELGRRLARRGMEIGAMTPDRLAEWVADRVQT